LKRIFKIAKRTALVFAAIILLITLTVFTFMKSSPQFGGKVSKEQKAEFKKLSHYENGKFTNAEPFVIKMDCHSVTEMLKETIRSKPHIHPDKNIEVVKFEVNQLNKDLEGKARVVWLGHSSFLIHIEDKVILIDPVFSDYAAPHKLLGRKRYNNEMPFDVMDLDKIDAVIISHDHYDHLDYPTINKIKDKIEHVIVPLGVGNHFKEWGFAADKIQEMDWWNETQLGNLKIAFTPSRHASGRGLSDQSSTLWGSWCLLGQNQKIFFSGDGGYGIHFKEIGAKYGPFDFGMVECGQYNEKWAGMHMVPEESVQAGLDAQIKTFMPIHWGAFTLANHTWTDPVERFTKKALELNAVIATPSIGQSIEVASSQYPREDWWEQFDE
jgi:L-ascorbate metabolism protein UlaG (beta-lactamase superfamily)